MTGSATSVEMEKEARGLMVLELISAAVSITMIRAITPQSSLDLAGTVVIVW